jgi:hypothetical protein
VLQGCNHSWFVKFPRSFCCLSLKYCILSLSVSCFLSPVPCLLSDACLPLPIRLLLSSAPDCASPAAIWGGLQSPQHIGSEYRARAAKPGGLHHSADLVVKGCILAPYQAGGDFPIRGCAVITYASILSPPVVVSGERTAAMAAVGDAGTRNKWGSPK